MTSSTTSPALARPIALAYVHRDFVAPGTPVAVAGQPAVVTALPFVGVSSIHDVSSSRKSSQLESTRRRPAGTAAAQLAARAQRIS